MMLHKPCLFICVKPGSARLEDAHCLKKVIFYVDKIIKLYYNI